MHTYINAHIQRSLNFECKYQIHMNINIDIHIQVFSPTHTSGNYDILTVVLVVFCFLVFDVFLLYSLFSRGHQASLFVRIFCFIVVARLLFSYSLFSRIRQAVFSYSLFSRCRQAAFFVFFVFSYSTGWLFSYSLFLRFFVLRQGYALSPPGPDNQSRHAPYRLASCGSSSVDSKC